VLAVVKVDVVAQFETNPTGPRLASTLAPEHIATLKLEVREMLR
jgi:hypothetical protein